MSIRSTSSRCARSGAFTVLCCSLIPLLAPGQASARAWGGTCGWVAVDAPRVQGGLLYGITAVRGDPGSAWAVGWNVDTDRALVLHEASGWEQVDTGLAGRLDDVTALSAKDVWAVGGRTIVHFDGTTWTKMTAPLPRHRFVSLSSLAAAAPDDVWVAGYAQIKTGYVTKDFLLHWDGRAWERVDAPNPSPIFNYLLSVAAAGPDDVWAVGTTARTSSSGGRWETFVIHWDGSRWMRVPSPSPGSDDNTLEDVVASSHGGGAWAVGQYSNGGVSGRTPLALRWTGTEWTPVSAPRVAGQVEAAALSGDGSLHAVGYFEQPFAALAATTATGGLAGVPAGGSGTDLIDVGFQGDGTGWAVGVRDEATFGLAPLIERWTCP